MTQKFIGNITVSTQNNNIAVCMPSDTKIPDKKEWFKYSIWQFNGKAYKPLTLNAENNLEKCINDIKATGKTCATKECKRKPSSIRYAILTTGIEDFKYV